MASRHLIMSGALALTVSSCAHQPATPPAWVASFTASKCGSIVWGNKPLPKKRCRAGLRFAAR